MSILYDQEIFINTLAEGTFEDCGMVDWLMKDELCKGTEDTIADRQQKLAE